MIKKVLPLLWITSSLVLCGCTNEKRDTNHTYSSQDVFYNVYYTYAFDKKCYTVKLENEIYDVPPSNYYEINLDEWHYINNDTIRNEYFVNSNELFVYYKQ